VTISVEHQVGIDPVGIETAPHLRYIEADFAQAIWEQSQALRVRTRSGCRYPKGFLSV
jgi:hypothetical protein